MGWGYIDFRNGGFGGLSVGEESGRSVSGGGDGVRRGGIGREEKSMAGLAISVGLSVAKSALLIRLIVVLFRCCIITLDRSQSVIDRSTVLLSRSEMLFLHDTVIS